MQRLSIWNRGGPPPTILCLGAHSDDIEIGCGGLVLRIRAERPDARFHWTVMSRSADPRREAEARSSAREMLGEEATIEVHDFRDAFFPYHGERIKEKFEELKQRVRPDMILTHDRDDRHQDHRVVSELTWNTFRNHLILEYEIPKFDGGLGAPNAFVPLERDIADRKLGLLQKHFVSQLTNAWFSPETFFGLMRLRGVECNAPSGYAEAFHIRKAVLSVGGPE